MGIINNKKPTDNDVLSSTPPVDFNDGDASNNGVSPEIEVLQAQIKALEEKLQKTIQEKEEQKKVYTDKIIEIYESREEKDEEVDERTSLQKHIDSCIAFINKGKKRKNI